MREGSTTVRVESDDHTRYLLYVADGRLWVEHEELEERQSFNVPDKTSINHIARQVFYLIEGRFPSRIGETDQIIDLVSLFKE